jgi:transposase
MRPAGPALQLVARRRRALRLLDEGLSLSEVARVVGCAPSSVMRWRDAVRRMGPSAVEVRSSPGRPSRLSAEQRHEIEALLAGSSDAPSVWTVARFARLVEDRFGVRYHKDHAGRLLRRLRPGRRPTT